MSFFTSLDWVTDRVLPSHPTHHLSNNGFHSRFILSPPLTRCCSNIKTSCGTVWSSLSPLYHPRLNWMAVYSHLCLHLHSSLSSNWMADSHISVFTAFLPPRQITDHISVFTSVHPQNWISDTHISVFTSLLSSHQIRGWWSHLCLHLHSLSSSNWVAVGNISVFTSILSSHHAKPKLHFILQLLLWR